MVHFQDSSLPNSRMAFTNISMPLGNFVNESITPETIFFSPEKSVFKENILTFLFLFAAFALQVKSKFQGTTKNGKKILNRIAPYAKWTPIRLPILDGLIMVTMLRKGGVKYIEEFYNNVRPNFNFTLGTLSAICCLDPVIVQKILSSSSPGHMNKPGIVYKTLFTNLLKDGLVVADHNTWIRHRKALSPAFTYKAFQTYVKFIHDGATLLEENFKKEMYNRQTNVLDNKTMKEFIDHTAILVATSIILGSEEFDIPLEARQQFHEDFRNFKNMALERFLRPVLTVKPVWMLHPMKRRMDKTQLSLKSFFNLIVEKYRSKDVVANTNDSKISSSSKLEQNEEDDCGIKKFECLVEQMIKSGLNNKEIVDEVSTFMVAGHETITTAIDLFNFHMAKNPEIQAKCQEEIDDFLEIKANSADKPISLDDLSQLKYLERCILESMRITPTIPYFLRILETPLEIGDDTIIEAGRAIVVSPWLQHRNLDLWPDPEKFDPDRFLPENIKQRHPYAYIPFSMGPRNCIGYKIAMMEIKIIMISLLRNFNLSTEDNLYDVKLQFDITLKPERIYNIKFHKREDTVQW